MVALLTLMITCTHSYRPTVYRALLCRLIRGCQILDSFWPHGRGSTYTWIDLYASMYGILEQLLHIQAPAQLPNTKLAGCNLQVGTNKQTHRQLFSYV